MKVTEKDVAYVADLAHLELTPEERTRMVTDLNAILGHVEALNELDTSKVPPMARVSAVEQAGTALRDDRTRPSLPRAAALVNAPETGPPGAEPAFFKVPKVIER